MDEFKRESMFHRQAQAAVLEGIKRLKSLGIPIRRPDDYFAEMAKSDDHMQKVWLVILIFNCFYIHNFNVNMC